MDRLEDELEDMPEGEHDDQVDAKPFTYKSPMVLRPWFNIMMIIVDILMGLAVFIIGPLAFGALGKLLLENWDAIPSLVQGWLMGAVILIVVIALGGLIRIYVVEIVLNTRRYIDRIRRWL